VPVLLFTRLSGILSHGTLGAMRSLGRLGVPVYWSVPEPLPAAASSRYAAGIFNCEEAASGDEVIAHLEEVRRELGARPILVPTDDVAARFVEEHAAALRPSFVFPEQPRGLPARLVDKRQMYELCLELGVPTPQTRFFSSREELVSIADSSSYPVVFKGIDTTLAGQETGFRMVIASDRDQLLRAHAALDDEREPRFMVQDYIPGSAQTTWMFNGYFDADSECRLGVCGRKLRQSPPYTGATSLGECRENPAVRDTTVSLMKRLGYRGILDIGYRFDRRDGQYKLLDANPRLGASFRLFVDSNGLDVVRALYSDLSGGSLSRPGSTVAGRKWLVETSDAASAIVYRRDGLLSTRAWLGSLRGIEETAWMAADDVKPGIRHYGVASRKLARLLKG